MNDTLEDLERQLAQSVADADALEARFPTGSEFGDEARRLEAFEKVEGLKQRIAARKAADA